MKVKMSYLLSSVPDRCLHDWANRDEKRSGHSSVVDCSSRCVALGPAPSTARHHSSRPQSQQLTLSLKPAGAVEWDPDSKIPKDRNVRENSAGGCELRDFFGCRVLLFWMHWWHGANRGCFLFTFSEWWILGHEGFSPSGIKFRLADLFFCTNIFIVTNRHRFKSVIAGCKS